MKTQTKTQMKGHNFDLKTVNFLPTHAQHEKAEGKKCERKEHMHGKHNKYGKPENFIREQFEEKEKELSSTNKVTGLWYPHKSK